jgi:hypothetical protein
MLEIGRVPTASLQLEPNRGHQLGQAFLAARGTNEQRLVGKALQRFEAVAAIRASIFVDGHAYLVAAKAKPAKGLIRKG